jgi:hypothetical protein
MVDDCLRRDGIIADCQVFRFRSRRLGNVGPEPDDVSGFDIEGMHLSARYLSSQGTCELHLSRDSSSPAYSSWLCI